jgi:rsbT co-antagonist protein RsbR
VRLSGQIVERHGERFILASAEDIAESKRTEEAERRSLLQEELIRIQEATLAELSTPLIPFNSRVVVMPLIGALDSRRAQQVIDTLLDGIASTHAQVVILDITGVSMVDTQVANGLIRAAQAVRLLGAEAVLTGIRPEVAQALVGLGIDLSSIVTRSTLQSGIAYAIGRN